MQHRVIFINNFVNVASIIASLAIAFFMSPFLVHNLGNYLYGIWAIALSALGYLNLMDLGMRTAIMKYAAENIGQKDQTEALSELLQTALVFYSIVALLCTIILLVILRWFLPLLNISYENISLVKLVFLILGLNLLLSFPGMTFRGILESAHFFYITKPIEIVFQLITAVAIYFAVSLGYSLVAMALIILLTNVCAHILFLFIILAKFDLKLITGPKLNRRRLKQMISYGFKSFLLMMANRLNFHSDSLIIGYFLSAAWVPFYSIPASLIMYCRNVLWALTQSFLPIFSNLDARNQMLKMQDIYLNYTRYTCIFFFPILIVVFVYGTQFLHIWMGPEFALRGGLILKLLTLSLAITAMHPLNGRLLQGVAKHEILVKAASTTASIFIILGSILISTSGIAGLGCAFLVGTSLPALYVMKRSLSYIKVSFTDFIVKGFGRPLLLAFFIAFLNSYSSSLYPVHSYLQLIIHTSLSYIFFYSLCFFFCLNINERNFVSVKLSNRLNAIWRKNSLIIKFLRSNSGTNFRH